VIPCFYDRESGGLPLRWLKKMKASMQMAMQDFSAQRMVSQYGERFYQPAAKNYQDLMAEEAREAIQKSHIHSRLVKLWQNVVVDFPVPQSEGPMRVGDKLKISVLVNLGDIKPEEVDVELCYGPPKTVDRLEVTYRETMTVEEALSDNRYLYSCTLPCDAPGRYGFTARITPRGDIWIRYTPGLIAWA
jgi:starch phosphorylase